MDVLVIENLGDFFLCVVGSGFAIAWPGTGEAKGVRYLIARFFFSLAALGRGMERGLASLHAE